MKQGKIYTKIVFVIVLITIVAYLGYASFSALRSPMATLTAIEYEAGRGLRTAGYVVREEAALTADYPITTLSVGEGQKVGKGQAVATGYETSNAQARQVQIEALQSQLKQLQFAHSYSVGGGADAAGLDTQITKNLTLYAQNVVRRDFSSATEQSPELKGLVLRRATGDTELASIRQQMDALQSQLQAVKAENGGDTKAITVASSGFFSGTVDGLETVLTPARMATIGVAELESITLPDPSAGAVGRLITDPTWYYVTAVPTEYLVDKQAGDTVSISFSHDFYSTLHMQINRIGDDENGERILVLESYDYIQDVTLLREQTANVIFDVYAGLRVPKDALRMNAKNQTGVYVLENAAAKWKSVSILFDNGESYVVALDKSTTDNLWPGDEIIAGIKDLYDGKVIS